MKNWAKSIVEADSHPVLFSERFGAYGTRIKQHCSFYRLQINPQRFSPVVGCWVSQIVALRSQGCVSFIGQFRAIIVRAEFASYGLRGPSTLMLTDNMMID